VKLSRVKVSVILPAYNAAGTIDRAIQSILKQKGVSLELLIGDDASTDETFTRMTAYKTDCRVQLFRFRKNQGVALMRNRLIAKAKGRYISACDADDMLLEGNLRKLSQKLDAKPSFGVAYADSLIVSPEGKRSVNRRFINEQSWELLGGGFADGGTLIRRSLIKKIGGYRPKFKYLEDCDLFVRLAEQTRFYYLRGKPLYCQYQTAGSLSDQSRRNLSKTSKIILNDAIQRRYGVQFKAQ